MLSTPHVYFKTRHVHILLYLTRNINFMILASPIPMNGYLHYADSDLLTLIWPGQWSELLASIGQFFKTLAELLLYLRIQDLLGILHRDSLWHDDMMWWLPLLLNWLWLLPVWKDPSWCLFSCPQTATLPAADGKHKHQDNERDPRVQNRPQYLHIQGIGWGYFREQVHRIVRYYPSVAEQIEDSNDKIYDRVLEDGNLIVSWSILWRKKGIIGLHLEFGGSGEKQQECRL